MKKYFFYLTLTAAVLLVSAVGFPAQTRTDGERQSETAAKTQQTILAQTVMGDGKTGTVSVNRTRPRRVPDNRTDAAQTKPSGDVSSDKKPPAGSQREGREFSIEIPTSKGWLNVIRTNDHKSSVSFGGRRITF